MFCSTNFKAKWKISQKKLKYKRDFSHFFTRENWASYLFNFLVIFQAKAKGLVVVFFLVGKCEEKKQLLVILFSLLLCSRSTKFPVKITFGGKFVCLCLNEKRALVTEENWFSSVHHKHMYVWVERSKLSDDSLMLSLLSSYNFIVISHNKNSHFLCSYNKVCTYNIFYSSADLPTPAMVYKSAGTTLDCEDSLYCSDLCNILLDKFTVLQFGECLCLLLHSPRLLWRYLWTFPSSESCSFILEKET